jgi:hypothetical protein
LQAVDALTTYVLSVGASLLLYVLFVFPLDSLCKLLASSCGGGGGVLCARTFTCKLGDSPLLGEWGGRNCHCGQSAARLAAKVHLDFSTFGLGSTSGKTLGRRHPSNSAVPLSSGNRHEMVTNGDHLSALSAEPLSGHLVQYNANGLLDLCSTHSRLGSSVDDLCPYLPTLNGVTSGFAVPIALSMDPDVTSTSIASLGPPLPSSNRPLLGGIHNQLGQNVAADIRRRLEQIKANALRPTRPDVNRHFGTDRLLTDSEQDRSGGSTSPQLAAQATTSTTTTLDTMAQQQRSGSTLANLNELSVDDSVDIHPYSSPPSHASPAPHSADRSSFNAFTFKV